MEHIQVVVRYVGGSKDEQRIADAEFTLTSNELATLKELVREMGNAGPDCVATLLGRIRQPR